jgi:thiosulfate/3-mercaptopyruvate sulfurtransferase
MLVEGAWLQDHLGDPNVRIVDCDTRDAYRRAHIPGAVFPSDTFLKNPDDRRFVMTPEQFAAEMKSLGIDDDTLVIAYDQASNTASRMWWALNYYGHTNVRVLNGGWQQWVAEGRPLSLKMAATATRCSGSSPGRPAATLERPNASCARTRSAARWSVPATANRRWRR